MNYKLQVPELNPDDHIMLNLVSEYFGYELVIDEKAKRYLIVAEEDIAYIQKSTKGLFIVWRKTEYMQYVRDLFKVVQMLDKNDVIPEEPAMFKSKFINGLCKMIGWIPGKTINEVICQKE